MVGLVDDYSLSAFGHEREVLQRKGAKTYGTDSGSAGCNDLDLSDVVEDPLVAHESTFCCVAAATGAGVGLLRR